MTNESGKRLVQIKYDWISGPLDGACGPAPTNNVQRMGNFRVWVGPDPGSPSEVVVYRLSIDTRRAIYSATLTKRANEVLRAQKNRHPGEQ